MTQVCDLHTHSIFSDGTYTPTQLTEEAEKIGLSAIALTDHNTVAGLPEFLASAQGKEIEAVPGVEFSTDYRGIDLHVVALYVKPESFPLVKQQMEEGQKRKEESNLALIEALNALGYPLDYTQMKACTPNGQVNRAHIAALMVKKGYVCSVQEAFSKFLEPKCGLYRPPERPDVFCMIEFINLIGAVPILAHPFLKLNEEQLRTFLRKACLHGLAGMETLYSTFDSATTCCAIEIAQEFHLIQSGGSDFHGKNKPDIQLGVGRGALAVPLAFLDKIKQLRR